MTSPEAPELPDFARNADERTTLNDMLDYYRAVLVRKTAGLTDEQLATRLPPSDLTLGGLLLHMALVEDGWFNYQFAGNDELEHWKAIPWDDDRDWEFNNAHTLPGSEIRTRFDDSVQRSRAIADAAGSLDQVSVRTRQVDDEPWNLRWILVHMIEEYARHCGHADFIRQAVDGATGD